ncbi:hypothetical protein PITCH_A640034 [uncultured Desulfobacterium sp.]|uniref:Formylmethanofuran dehydrogenase subunit E domain-containing protein n=1 Tax=uncultured Desulfobacterium sp. TaxID=201089 RepID=A0A445N1B8_9BACT|nr:hypothetical protein PITCH_A640034 [uncultured Desulfobacterium sp.]
MNGNKLFKIGFIIGSLVLCIIALRAWDHALAGCKGWDGAPIITMKLPNKGGESCKNECMKNCEKKENEKPCGKGKEGCGKSCGSYITLGIKDIKKFHGEVCPGVALGYRACQIALSNLYPGEIAPRGDQFVVCGTARACPADAVSFITGARYSKGSNGAFNGNLAFDETIGNSSYIFASMTSGKAIKLNNKFEFPKEFEEAKAKKDTDPEAKALVSRMGKCISNKILTAPDKEIFEVTQAPDFSWKEYKEKYLK